MLPVTVILVLITVLAGCATRSVFNPYPSQAQEWRSAVTASSTPSRLQQGSTSRDAPLYLQELGRVALLQGDTATSREAFAKAIQRYDQQDAAARVQGSSLVAGTTSLLTNDNALPYRVPDYERIFAHAYQALNYWLDNDAEGAAVELRAAALEQQVAAQRRDREIARAEEAAKEEGVNLSEFDSQFAALNTAAGEVKASFQNAWTFYVSALFWEAQGDLNAARVDLIKALEIHPQLDFLQRDLKRVDAAMSGRRESGGQLAVFFEQDFVPARDEFSLFIPTIHGSFAIAFPTYFPQNKPAPRPLQVRLADGRSLFQTAVLADVGGLAARDLQERRNGMLVRQVMRASTKYNLQQRANEDFGIIGAFATQLYNLVSEQADRRSWLTLPAYAQAGSVRLPAGDYRITLQVAGVTRDLDVTIVDQGLTAIHVVAVPGDVIVRTLPRQEG